MANPFVHIELTSDDPVRAKEFYGKLLDWTLEDIPMEGDVYTLIHVGDRGAGGGIMKTPAPGIPTRWLPYIEVDDVAKKTALTTSLGGRVEMEKTEVPGIGWFAVITDPTGGVVGLWETMNP
ncbi:MAG: VOC family protein [Deltaproteobacteria bacterium]|nr:VOC family protein [Candidatus Zymogenaceae bacterium]